MKKNRVALLYLLALSFKTTSAADAPLTEKVLSTEVVYISFESRKQSILNTVMLPRMHKTAKLMDPIKAGQIMLQNRPRKLSSLELSQALKGAEQMAKTDNLLGLRLAQPTRHILQIILGFSKENQNPVIKDVSLRKEGSTTEEDLIKQKFHLQDLIGQEGRIISKGDPRLYFEQKSSDSPQTHIVIDLREGARNPLSVYQPYQMDGVFDDELLSTRIYDLWRGSPSTKLPDSSSQSPENGVSRAAHPQSSTQPSSPSENPHALNLHRENP